MKEKEIPIFSVLISLRHRHCVLPPPPTMSDDKLYPPFLRHCARPQETKRWYLSQIKLCLDKSFVLTDCHNKTNPVSTGCPADGILYPPIIPTPVPVLRTELGRDTVSEAVHTDQETVSEAVLVDQGTASKPALVKEEL